MGSVIKSFSLIHNHWIRLDLYKWMRRMSHEGFNCQSRRPEVTGLQAGCVCWPLSYCPVDVLAAYGPTSKAREFVKNLSSMAGAWQLTLSFTQFLVGICANNKSWRSPVCIFFFTFPLISLFPYPLSMTQLFQRRNSNRAFSFQESCRFFNENHRFFGSKTASCYGECGWCWPCSKGGQFRGILGFCIATCPADREIFHDLEIWLIWYYHRWSNYLLFFWRFFALGHRVTKRKQPESALAICFGSSGAWPADPNPPGASMKETETSGGLIKTCCDNRLFFSKRVYIYVYIHMICVYICCHVFIYIYEYYYYYMNYDSILLRVIRNQPFSAIQSYLSSIEQR